MFLAGRSRAKLDVVAADIAASGGLAEVAVLDCFDATEALAAGWQHGRPGPDDRGRFSYSQA